MKIAYLILAHQNPAQVFNLIHRLNSVDNYFFIHFKKGLDFEVPEDLSLMNNVNFAKIRYKSGWCGFKVILANLHLIELAQETNVNFDYYINLSSNCYPIHSNDFIDQNLSKSNKIYLEGHLLPYHKLENNGLPKIYFPWFQDSFQNINSYIKKFSHKLLHSPMKLLKIKRKFPADLEPYFGSQWYALTQAAITYLLSYIKNNPKSLLFFKYSWCSDEQVIQSIIFSSPFFSGKIINKPFRYIDWNINGPPKTLTLEDYDKILSSNALFARKFVLNISASLIKMLDNEKPIKYFK